MTAGFQTIGVNGRVLAAIALWVFSIVTGVEWWAAILTLPTFALVLARLNAIRSENFTPQDMLWLIVLLFFVVSPNQAIKGLGFVGGPTIGIEYEPVLFIKAQLIVLIGVGIIAHYDAKAGRALARTESGRSVSISSTGGLWIFLISLLAFLVYIQLAGGVSNVMAPRRERVRDDVSFLAVAFLAMLALGTMLQASRRNRGLLGWGALIASALMLAFCINPLNAPRFFILASWFPVAMLVLGGSFTYPRVYLAIVGGIAVVMPIISLTSRRGLEGVTRLSDSSYASDIYRLKDMDVFDTLVHSIWLMERKSYLLGENLMAILLFFVPRSFWPEKPVVGGLVVGEDLYLNSLAGTDNLSFFLGGDLYMDFGYIGVVLGFVVVGLLWKKVLTTNYLKVEEKNFISCVLTGSIPILVRGPLGSVVGYFFCLVCASFVYKLVLRIKLGRATRHRHMRLPSQLHHSFKKVL